MNTPSVWTRFLSALSLMCIAAAPAYAGVPSWISAAGGLRNPHAGVDVAAEVLLDQTEVKVGAKLTVRVRLRRVFRVRTSEGVPLAVLRIGLEPDAVVQAAHGWTLRAGQVVGEVDETSIVEHNLVTGVYQDVRTAALVSPQVRGGDIVAFEATWTESEPFPLHLWSPTELGLAVARAEFAMDLPAHWTASLHGYNLDQPLVTPQGEHVAVSVQNLPPATPEPLLPSLQSTLPRVVVRFRSGADDAEFDQWNSIAAWFQRLSRDRCRAQLCPQPLAGRADPGVLAREVQTKIRYVAIELGKQRWIPDRADSTWLRRYGDCKDKAALMASALSANGIESRLVLVRTREAGDVDPESPDPWQFNHCIVAMAWNGDTALASATITGPSGRRWTLFDPTNETLPLGGISTAIGGGWAVIADSAEGLVRLPEPSRSRSTCEVTGALDESGELHAQLRVTANGPESAYLLTRFGGVGALERRYRASVLLRQRWPLAELDSCRVLFGPPGSQQAGIAIEFRLAGAAQRSGEHLLFTPQFFTGWSAPPPSDTLRRHEIVLGAPGLQHESWELALPAGWRTEQPALVDWRGDVATYHMTSEARAGRLRLERVMELKQRQLPAGEYASARALMQAMYSGDHLPLLLVR